MSCAFKVLKIPQKITGAESDVLLGKSMVDAWRADGLYYLAVDDQQQRVIQNALAASRNFAQRPLSEKCANVSELSYSGYVGSGTEFTDEEADLAEVFTVCRDIALNDARVKANWPCHGPVPWPSADFELAIKTFTVMVGSFGERMLKLIALGLGLNIESLAELAVDGWHLLRLVHIPSNHTKKIGEFAKGIGAHTDYGMLVLLAQDEVGEALYVRPPVEGEKRNKNWRESESTAGMYEDVEPWNYVAPIPNTMACIPGDCLQFLTSDFLLSTPHKVEMSNRDRYSIAYFHEPNFNAVLRPLADPENNESIHYGTHFTNMLMRSYPDRITTKCIEKENRLKILENLREQALGEEKISL